ncbi:hypothetical protein TrispH2_002527 [Trichoplax sp. H2]|nr:hypothetical protein TrispH2_002527 [Trichoplax sp. H2]|eukprot:RDD45154.1 hypothetical protein TrispH2_002527 [Trichoplax sp. H2]
MMPINYGLNRTHETETISQVDYDEFIFNTFKNLRCHDDYEIRLESLKMILSLTRLKGILPTPNTLSIADISLLIELISSPYEDLALKSLQIIAEYAIEILFLRYEIIHKSISVIHNGKSVQFLQCVARTIKQCMNKPLTFIPGVHIDDREYYVALRDNSINLIPILSDFLKSNDIDICIEVTKILHSLLTEKNQILSSSIANLSQHSNEEVMAALKKIPVVRIYEILASQSPRLCKDALEILHVLLVHGFDDRHDVKILIGLKVIPVLKITLLDTRNEFHSALQFLYGLASSDSMLLQGIIDHDLFSIIFTATRKISDLPTVLTIRALTDIARLATTEQMEQLVINQYIIQYLHDTLMKSEDRAIVRKIIEGMAEIVKKSKQLPKILENNKSEILLKLEMMRRHGPWWSVAPLAMELIHLLHPMENKYHKKS